MQSRCCGRCHARMAGRGCLQRLDPRNSHDSTPKPSREATMNTPHTLTSTVGTSLFASSLEPLARRLEAPGTESGLSGADQALAQAYRAQDWREAARRLGEFEASARVCGAEINSIADLVS